MENRIERRLRELASRNEKAFITYLTAGLPDMETTNRILLAEEEAGLDIAEIGVPFSDPVADGPVIQAASYRSIQGGTNLARCFEGVRALRSSGSELPVVFMLYSNTIFYYGLEAFVQQCRETGVDGLIVPDLPIEEQEGLRNALSGDDRTILLQLVSPVSGDRIPEIVKDARGFIYCVSSMGVTGSKNFHREILSYLTSVKNAARIPVMMGFGIREAADIEPMKEIIDGAIVGSHFIQLMEESGFDPQAARDYVAKFKAELK